MLPLGRPPARGAGDTGGLVMPVVIYPPGGQSQNHFLGVAPRHGTKGSVKGRSRRIESARIYGAPIARSDTLPHSTPMFDIFSKQPIYTFPLDSIVLKSRNTGGYVKADIVQLTKQIAYLDVDYHWRTFRGPFRTPCPVPADSHWKWGSYVRRLRKNLLAKCAAARTADNVYQGAIIYRRDGVSLLQPNTGAVYVEYIASAPHNRHDYAEKPLYSGVGEGLMYLAMLDSYQWGLGGRVALFSLPSAVGFHKKMKFFPTGSREDGMIHCELTPEAAVEFMQDKGLI